MPAVAVARVASGEHAGVPARGTEFRELAYGDAGRIAESTGSTPAEAEAALVEIRALDPRPGQRFLSLPDASVQPDVVFSVAPGDFRVTLIDEDLPDLRLSRRYGRLLDRRGSDPAVRSYLQKRLFSAWRLLRGIEQRRHVIQRTCEAIARRQREFLASGIDSLHPMRIKEVAQELGVHPSTVSRAVANKFAQTPHGVYELRSLFFSLCAGSFGSVGAAGLAQARHSEDDQSRRSLRALDGRGRTQQAGRAGYPFDAPQRGEAPAKPGHSGDSCAARTGVRGSGRHARTCGETFTMKIDYTGRKAELSDRERGKLQRKFDKVQRILSGRADLEAHVTLSRQRHLFEAEVTLRALRHTLVVAGNGVNPFAAMRAALEKLEKQAVRNKHKIIDTHRPGRQRGRPSVLVRDSLQRIAGSTAADGSHPARGRIRIVRSRGVETQADDCGRGVDGT